MQQTPPQTRNNLILLGIVILVVLAVVVFMLVQNIQKNQIGQEGVQVKKGPVEFYGENYNYDQYTIQSSNNNGLTGLSGQQGESF